MRLLDTSTLQLADFFGRPIPRYAILSHTWEDDEVLFQDMADLVNARSKAGFAKIEGACALAASNTFQYIWIDTCCIDKSSSAELAEAINSMFRWYSESQVCYTYLCDIPSDGSKSLETSRWFTRGWTLQELIAPRTVEFYSQDWKPLGHKGQQDVLSVISSKTHIDECVLTNDLSPLAVSVARRMYWASSRVTTRKEDEAYCLLGLFGIHMSLIYGERSAAFERLQEEIFKTNGDHSILAWYTDDTDTDGRLVNFLADSPRQFKNSGEVSMIPFSRYPSKDAEVTSTSIRLRMVLLCSVDPRGDSERGRYSDDFRWATGLLDCQWGHIPGCIPTLSLCKLSSETEEYLRFLGPGPRTLPLHDIAALEKSHQVAHGLNPQMIQTYQHNLGEINDKTIFRELLCLVSDMEFAADAFRSKWKLINVQLIRRPAVSFYLKRKYSRSTGLSFWLLPTESRYSKVSVTDIISPRSCAFWDRASLRCFTRKDWNGVSGLMGVARIHAQVLSGQSHQVEREDRALLLFGFKGDVLSRSSSSAAYGFLPDHADLSMEEVLQAVQSGDLSHMTGGSVINLESGIALKARMRQTNISGEYYQLITLEASKVEDI
jgi:hypothetical protein